MHEIDPECSGMQTTLTGDKLQEKSGSKDEDLERADIIYMTFWARGWGPGYMHLELLSTKRPENNSKSPESG